MLQGTTKDRVALFFTTFGVGYIPGAPGTYGSLIGVAIYLGVSSLNSIWLHHWAPLHGLNEKQSAAIFLAAVLIVFLLFILLGICSAGRAIDILDDKDPPQAVVDEVIGQLIVFLFLPFGLGWIFILAGFLLFRLFDIWKPYPIDYLQSLPRGIGVCADDILAGVYAGIVLSLFYAVWI